MKLDQKSISFKQLKTNVKNSIRKIDKSYCSNFINYAYKKKQKINTKKNISTWKHKPKKYK